MLLRTKYPEWSNDLQLRLIDNKREVMRQAESMN
jgi:hypothetical protein